MKHTSVSEDKVPASAWRVDVEEHPTLGKLFEDKSGGVENRVEQFACKERPEMWAGNLLTMLMFDGSEVLIPMHRIVKVIIKPPVVSKGGEA